MSTFGEVGIEERAFVQAGHLLRPFSASAGIKCRGYSGPLQRRMTDFGVEKSFAKAALQLKEHFGLDVSASTIRSITHAHGERLLEAPRTILGPVSSDWPETNDFQRFATRIAGAEPLFGGNKINRLGKTAAMRAVLIIDEYRA